MIAISAKASFVAIGGRSQVTSSTSTVIASAAPTSSCSAMTVPVMAFFVSGRPAMRVRRASTAMRATSPTRANSTVFSRKPMNRAGTTWA